MRLLRNEGIDEMEYRTLSLEHLYTIDDEDEDIIEADELVDYDEDDHEDHDEHDQIIDELILDEVLVIIEIEDLA